MAFDFKLPDLGEGIHEGEIKKWLVKEGDVVKEHQPIAEVETDKAVVDLPSPKSGKILKINFKEGDTVKVGDVVIVIGDSGEKVSAKTAKTPAKTPVKEAKAPAKTAKKPARRIAKGATGAVGELEEAPDDDEEPVKVAKPIVSKVSTVEALPAVRKLAQKLKVDLTTVHGTGPSGRITEADVKNVSGKAPAVKVDRGPRVTFESFGRVLRVPLKGLRKKISENLTRAFQTTVPVTHMDEIDVTDLNVMRKKRKKIAEDKGYKLTYLPFIAKAVVIALKEHPYVNSSLDDDTGEMVLKKYYNLGFAVDTLDGLIVPVVKGCDQKSILDIAKDLFIRAEEARSREISIDNLKGGTFTITNIGSLGGIFATPVINHPECAILGLGAIKDKPVVIDGEIVIRKMLPVSLTFDHRIIDGAEAARFVNDVKKHLEDPELMLLEAF